MYDNNGPATDSRRFTLRFLLALTAGCAGVSAASRFWGLPAFICGLFLLAEGVGIWHSPSRRTSAVRFAIGYAGLGLAAVLLWPRVNIRTTPRAVICGHNLRLVGLALMAYEHDHGQLPPAYTVDESGNRLHSWRTLILWHLEYGHIYEKIRFDEPWDSEHNSQFHDQLPPFFACPSRDDYTRNDTHYVAIVGPGTLWPGDTSESLLNVKDDPARTILLVEVAKSGIHWMEPRDLENFPQVRIVNSKEGPSISSLHPRGVNVVFVNGERGLLVDTTPPDKINAMLTIAGGQPDAEEE